MLRERWIVVRDTPSTASRRVALTRAASLVRDGYADLVDQVGLDDGERSHLLPYPLCLIPFGALGPFHSAHLTVGAAGTLLGGCDGGGLDPRHHGGLDERGVFDGGDEPTREVGFERIVVRITGVGRFAGNFVHDVGRVGGEENRRGVKDAQNPLLPESRTVGL